MDQDELTCHAMGERRMNYLNQIRCILDQMDDTPCSPACNAGAKPLLQYPGYINRKNPEFKKPTFGDPCSKTHEAYEEYLHISPNEMSGGSFPTGPCGKANAPSCGQHQQQPHHTKRLVGGQGGGCGGPKNVEVAMYVQVPVGQEEHHGMAQQRGVEDSGPSTEYIGGCDCTRHNGLQDQCDRLECIGNPACLTDPPSCPPARGMPKVHHVNIHQKYENIFCHKLPTEDKHRIC